MYLVPNIHPGSGSAGVPTVTGNFAVPASDWTTLSTLSSLPTGGSISRAGQAMYYDSTGKLTYAPNNLVTYSEQFDNAAWAKSNVSITANTTTAPDGTSTADKVVEDTATVYHYAYASISVVLGTVYCISVYAKASERSVLQISTSSSAFGANAFANFNLSNGTLGTVGSSASANIVAVGNGWYRCSIAATAIASTTLFLGLAPTTSTTSARLASYTGDGTSGLFIWGAQLEAITYQTTPSTYVATTSAAYYGPRFDYNPSTLAAKGLLIEGTRTNLLTYSEQFDNAFWPKTGVTITVNAIASPDGTASADKIVEDSTTAAHVVGPSLTTTAAYYTASVYAKAGERSIVCLRFYEGGAGGLGSATYFNLATGVIGSNAAGNIASIQAVGNGWYRCVVTRNLTAGATLYQILTCVVDGSYTYAGVAGNGLYIWGAQVEQASFPSSYIPTTSAAVTRAAETFAITGYSTNLIEALYTDEATGGSWSANYNAGTDPSPTDAWLTSLRVYTNAYAGDIATPSWIDNSGTTGNRMVTDSTGALTWAPANLLLNSATLSTQTVTGGVSASGDYILSFKGTGSVAISGGNTGSLAGTGASNLVSLKFTTTTASLTFTVTGSVTEAQLERVTYQTQPRAYIPTTTAAVYQPRYDFDASTVPATPRGMLIEESRANSLKSSANLTTSAEGNAVAAWGTGSGGVDAAGTFASGVSPDGSNTATLLNDASAAAVAGRMQTITITSGTTTYSGSIYLKAGASSVASIRLALSGGTVAAAELVVNLATGAAQWRTALAGSSFSINSAGNGWYRVSIVVTDNASGNTSLSLEVRPAFAQTYSPTIDAAAVGSCLAWGAQVETGSFATSYIPTTSASVTRVADVVKLTGSALTVAGANTGSAILQTSLALTGVKAAGILGDYSNRRLLYNPGSNTNVYSYDGVSGSAATLGSGTWTGGAVRAAVSWDAIGFSTVANNGVVASKGSVGSPQPMGSAATVALGGVSSVSINAWIGSAAFYNQRLPDAILKQKSSVGAPY